MSETDNNKNTLEKIKKFIEDNTSVALTVSSMFVSIYSLLSYIFKHLYSMKAEKFYEIPNIYFVNEIVGKNFFRILFMFLYIIILFTPFILKGFRKKYKIELFESILYSFMLTILNFYVFLLVSIELINIFDFKISHNREIIILIEIISFFIYVFVFITDLKKETINEKIKKNITIFI